MRPFILALGLFLLPVSLALAANPTPQQAIDSLNALRSANGIPAGITLNQSWSEKCKTHNHYMALNDMVHDENPSAPGYTEEGNWCGTNSVLASSYGWGSASTPWDTAPIHLAQILAPQLRESGAFISEGFSSLTTWPGYNYEAASRDALYAYPNAQGPVAPSELASEWPFTPQKFVGISEQKTTGPYLYIFADGPWADYNYNYSDQVHITSASLTGPAGAVAIKTVDDTTPTLGDYLPPSGMIIPVDPLRGGAHYSVSVTMSNSQNTLTKNWEFDTSLLRNNGSLIIYPLPRNSFHVSANSTVAGVLTVKKGVRVVAKKRGLINTFLKLSQPGLYQFCYDSGGEESEYQAFHTCQTIRTIRR
jgi:hypothetical protein